MNIGNSSVLGISLVPSGYTGQSILSFSVQAGGGFQTVRSSEERLSEKTPAELFSQLGTSIDWKPETIFFTTGPGSYTALRIGCAFVKGLALAYRCPVVSTSLLELGFLVLSSMDRVVKSSDQFRIAVQLGADRFVFASGEEVKSFSSANWRIGTREELVSGAPIETYILRSAGAESLSSGSEIQPIVYSSALIECSGRAEDQRSEGIAQIAQLSPEYGLHFQVLTQVEQEAYREKRREANNP